MKQWISWVQHRTYVCIEQQDIDSCDDRKMAEFVGCLCSKWNGHPCCGQFSTEYVKSVKLSFADLTTTELDLRSPNGPAYPSDQLKLRTLLSVRAGTPHMKKAPLPPGEGYLSPDVLLFALLLRLCSADSLPLWPVTTRSCVFSRSLKNAVFGACCEAIPRHVNFLIVARKRIQGGQGGGVTAPPNDNVVGASNLKLTIRCIHTEASYWS